MKKSTAVDILNGPIWKQILIFFFPILLGTFFQQIYNTTDTVIVGNYVGKRALAAVGGSPFYIINLFIGFSIGVSSGASVVIAQFFGSKKQKHLSKAIHTSLAMSIILGVIMTITMLILGKHVLSALKVPQDAMDFSLSYLNIISLGFVFSMLYNMATGIFRAIGDTRKPLYFLIISCITNIFLDILFVVYLKMEVKGVAIATILSQAFSAFLALYSLYRTNDIYRIIPREIRISPKMLSRIISIGIPRGLQSVLFSVSNMIVQSSLNLMGTDAIAGWTVDIKIEMLYWMVVNCFGVAITTFTAQNFGAKKYDRVYKGIRVSMGLTAGATLFLSVLIYTLGPIACHFFTKDATVISVASSMLKFVSPFYIGYVAVEIFAGSLYGIGISVMPMFITAMGICTFRILWIITVVGNKPTLYNIITCYPISWFLTSILFLIYFLLSKRRKTLMATK